MQISCLLLCCTILQAAFYVDILVITLLHNIVGSVLCRQISWSLFCCTILQAVYYVDILVVFLLHIIVGSVLYRYLFITLLHNIAAQYCRQRTIYISWSLLSCTILQAAYYVDILVAAYYVYILVVTLLHNIVGSVLCRYLGHYFAAQYCSQRTMQIYWSLLAAQYCRQRIMQISWSLLCCTIL